MRAKRVAAGPGSARGGRRRERGILRASTVPTTPTSTATCGEGGRPGGGQRFQHRLREGTVPAGRGEMGLLPGPAREALARDLQQDHPYGRLPGDCCLQTLDVEGESQDSAFSVASLAEALGEGDWREFTSFEGDAAGNFFVGLNVGHITRGGIHGVFAVARQDTGQWEPIAPRGTVLALGDGSGRESDAVLRPTSGGDAWLFVKQGNGPTRVGYLQRRPEGGWSLSEVPAGEALAHLKPDDLAWGSPDHQGNYLFFTADGFSRISRDGSVMHTPLILPREGGGISRASRPVERGHLGGAQQVTRCAPVHHAEGCADGDAALHRGSFGSLGPGPHPPGQTGPAHAANHRRRRRPRRSQQGGHAHPFTRSPYVRAVGWTRRPVGSSPTTPRTRSSSACDRTTEGGWLQTDRSGGSPLNRSSNPGSRGLRSTSVFPQGRAHTMEFRQFSRSAMNFELTDVQREIQRMCREFAAKELIPNARKWDEPTRGPPTR